MPTSQTIGLFMLSAFAINLTPGPSILFILSRCATVGRSAAIVSVFGLATASLVHAVLVAFGLSALLLYSPVAFAAVKYCGAAYLIYLGVRGFLESDLGKVAIVPKGRRAWSVAGAYWQGVLTDLLNPKVVMFFFSFLPQFVDAGRGDPRVQMLVLGLLFQVTGLPTNLAVAIAGSSLTRFLARNHLPARVQKWCASTVLIGLGLRLTLSERR
jgi:threonine/homoserine/homoserine lactone efflux protein